MSKVESKFTQEEQIAILEAVHNMETYCYMQCIEFRNKLQEDNYDTRTNMVNMEICGHLSNKMHCIRKDISDLIENIVSRIAKTSTISSEDEQQIKDTLSMFETMPDMTMTYRDRELIENVVYQLKKFLIK